MHFSTKKADKGRREFWKYFDDEECKKRDGMHEMIEDIQRFRKEEGDGWMVPRETFVTLWAAVVSEILIIV